MRSPVALIIFNRPEETLRVFQAIARVKPKELFVIADGPRAGRQDDIESCAAAREVVENISWDCKVYKNYSENNLGCGLRPATGISWVFEQVEEAIILEDDCIPDPSFFRFCDDLIERYRNDMRIAMIGGRNNLVRDDWGPYSYHFTRIPNCWGWATWRRAWRFYQFSIPLWRELRDSEWLKDVLGDDKAIMHWRTRFDRAYLNDGDIDYWDHQWSFTCWSQNGLAVAPNINLVANIGFGDSATHTSSNKDFRAQIRSHRLSFPIRHPPYVTRDVIADRMRFQKLFRQRGKWYQRLYGKMRGLIAKAGRVYQSQHS
jgi:hypothetical protein